MHEHKECKHELKYCKKCDMVYCEKCKKEWSPNYSNYSAITWTDSNGTYCHP